MAPTGNVETTIFAEVTPPEVERVPVPSVVLPIVRVTVPVGAPAPGATAATVTVNVTGESNTEGLGVDASVVVVSAFLTTCVSTLDVLALKFESPL